VTHPIFSISELLFQIETHLRQGSFARSLAFIAGFSAFVSGLEVAQEHYRGSYGQPIMYSPLICCALVGVFGILGAFIPPILFSILPWVSALLILDGAIGFGFHIRGIMRKPGGFTKNLVVNIVMGPPIFAPLLLGISGLLGIIAAHLVTEDSGAALAPNSLESLRVWLALATAFSAALNGFEALYSHYKSNFNSRSQWIPILLAPPIAVVGIFAIYFPDSTRFILEVLSIVAIFAGLVGAGFHLNGIRKRPGGRDRLFYNIIYGPPPFAPLLFAATGFLGLLANQIGRTS
jgi:hypothetical protein